jgi:hypothetical protein
VRYKEERIARLDALLQLQHAPRLLLAADGAGGRRFHLLGDLHGQSFFWERALSSFTKMAGAHYLLQKGCSPAQRARAMGVVREQGTRINRRELLLRPRPKKGRS